MRRQLRGTNNCEHLTLSQSNGVQVTGEIAITPTGRTAYVVNQGFAYGTVTPIAIATMTPGKPIKVGKDPFAIAPTPLNWSNATGRCRRRGAVPPTSGSRRP